MADPTTPPQKSNEVLALEATREHLKASIAARDAQQVRDPEFAAATNREKARLKAIEDRLAELGAAEGAANAAPNVAKPTAATRS